MDAFMQLDRNNSGTVDKLKLQLFLKDCDYVATDEELVAIIRRIDLDGDDCISLWEFKELLPPEYQAGPMLPESSVVLQSPIDCYCVYCKAMTCVCKNVFRIEKPYPVHEEDFLVRTLI